MWALSLVWMPSLALVDGVAGVGAVLTRDSEYLVTAREVDDVGELLRSFVSRIPLSAKDHWPVHVAGHPPGALLFFVVWSGWAWGPGWQLVWSSALWQRPPQLLLLSRVALSVFITESGLCCLSSSSARSPCGRQFLPTRSSPPWRRGRLPSRHWPPPDETPLPSVGRSLRVSPLEAASCGRTACRWSVSWSSPRWPVPSGGPAGRVRLAGAISVGVACVVGAFALAGFAYWGRLSCAAPKVLGRLASARPAGYWLWANVALLAVSAGPLLFGALAVSGRRLLVSVRRPQADPLLSLAGAALLAVIVADLSLMSKAEVERIWLPFVPWLLLSAVVLPARWRRPALGAQAGLGLLVQTLLVTPW